MDGVEAIRRIAPSAPGTRVVVLTSFLDDDKVLPAVRAGAAGYLLKDVEPAGARARRSAPSTAARRCCTRRSPRG